MASLSPELQQHIIDGSVGRMVHHPLVVCYLAPGSEDHLNQLLVSKRRAITNLVMEKKYSQCVWLFERPYRLDGLEQYGALIEDAEQHASLVRQVWVDTEFPHHNVRRWNFILGETAPLHFMDTDDKMAYDALSDIVTLYRGTDQDELDIYAASGRAGLSWTTDESRAKWFAERFAGSTGKQPIVMRQTCPKSDIFACVGQRGEDEVIVLQK